MHRRHPRPARALAVVVASVSVVATASCDAFSLDQPRPSSSSSPAPTQPATDPIRRTTQSGLSQKVGTHPRTGVSGGAMVVASASATVPAGIVSAGAGAVTAVRSLDPHASTNPLLVVVPRDAAEYKAYTGSEPGNQLASTVTRGGILPFVVMSPWTVKHPNSLTTKETLAHEAFHALTLEKLPTNRPLWLLEGWAEYVGQKAVPQAPHKLVGIHPHVPSDEELRGTHASDAYYVAFTFARYLRDTYGNDAVMAFYTDAVTTTSSMEALATKHFGKGVTALETGYVAWYPTFR